MTWEKLIISTMISHEHINFLPALPNPGEENLPDQKLNCQKCKLDYASKKSMEYRKNGKWKKETICPSCNSKRVMFSKMFGHWPIDSFKELSEENQILLMFYQGVRHSFFQLPSEVGGRIAAIDSKTGKRIWDIKAKYQSHPVINGDKIYAQGGAWDLKTWYDVS